MSSKRALFVAGPVLLTAGVVSIARRRRRSHRSTGATWRDVPGRLRGATYRLSGRHPSPDVDDRTLADRIRSSIGPVTHRLDLPHVHVMVHRGVAALHGDVATHADAEEIIDAVLAVSGVQGVDTHLHVGLVPSDTRPSAGHDRSHPSPALDRLIAAATSAGADTSPLFVIRATLGTLLRNIPPGERRHVLGHFPHDVRLVVGQPWRRYAHRDEPVDGLSEVRRAVGLADPTLGPEAIDAVIDAVFATIAELVPEERHDIAAVLPSELRERWRAAARPTATDVPVDA